MKKLSAILLGFTVLFNLGAEEAIWLTDLPKAQAKAAAEHKLVLLDFTGSDWCGWCIKLHNEVFSKPEFDAYAAKNLVLVEVDFPSKKPQSKELRAANQALQKKYRIEGYPTLVVLSEKGKELNQLGYEKGGPRVFIAKLEALKKKN